MISNSIELNLRVRVPISKCLEYLEKYPQTPTTGQLFAVISPYQISLIKLDQTHYRFKLISRIYRGEQTPQSWVEAYGFIKADLDLSTTIKAQIIPLNRYWVITLIAITGLALLFSAATLMALQTPEFKLALLLVLPLTLLIWSAILLSLRQSKGMRDELFLKLQDDFKELETEFQSAQSSTYFLR